MRWSLKKRALAAAATMTVGAGLLAGLAPTAGVASSHREAPLISADPQADTTDVYAFVSPDDDTRVTLIASWLPFEEPAGGPNFYSFAEGTNYDIHIDNDGDAKAEVTYRWKFTDHRRGGGNSFLYANGPVTTLDDENLLQYQTYDLRRLVPGSSPKTMVDDAIVVPSNVGEATMPDFESLSDDGTTAFGGSKSWAGQSDDPFFLDLRVFDLLYGGDLSEVGDDTLAGFNVQTAALQVPKGRIARGGDADANPIVGIWSTVSRRSMTVNKPNGSQVRNGEVVQVSRLGMPLVNEVVIPVKLKDRFNASKPSGDGQFLSYVNDPELPRLLNAVYGLDIPDSDPGTPGVQREDLISVFLTGVDGLNQPSGVTASEMLRLNMSIDPCDSGCSTLGVIGGDTAGFPNGRRLDDDIIDISLQVVEGELIGSPNDLGDAVDQNDVPFESSFPYVGYAHAGSLDDPHTVAP
ncbi:MAG: DUF4331 domain-containing protein [Actinomycetota bacterium]